MGSLVCPCCCCCYSRAAVRRLHWAAFYSQKSIAIEERPVWRLHWSAFSSQKECVWQLNQSVSRKWRSGLNRIGHPDWVKLSVELNCVPNQNTKFFLSLQAPQNLTVLFGLLLTKRPRPEMLSFYSALCCISSLLLLLEENTNFE